MKSELSHLKVHYGWSVLNKVRRKPALSVIFENTEDWTGRNLKSINRLQTTCFVRNQTVQEAEDGRQQNRSLTEYSLFLYEKPFNGNLEIVLSSNYQADINNVSEDVLEQIKSALHNGFKLIYQSRA